MKRKMNENQSKNINSSEGKKKDTHGSIAVDVFSRKTFAEPMHGACAEEAVKSF